LPLFSTPLEPGLTPMLPRKVTLENPE